MLNLNKLTAIINDEVCYPATLIVGDVIKALKEYNNNPSQIAVCMTQTGGLCRASNYMPLLKKAMAEAGFKDVPVLSLTFNGDLGDDQSYLEVNWAKMLPVALRTVLFSDCINKLYHAAAVREKSPGAAVKLREMYLGSAAELIKSGHSSQIQTLLKEAVDEFTGICTDKDCPKIGIVGEIYLKFNRYAHQGITDWLIEQGIEVVPPVLTDFFMQNFVNRQAKVKAKIEGKCISDYLRPVAFRLFRREIERMNEICRTFPYYTPIEDIFATSRLGEKIITLNAQFGEGWLLPAEISSLAEQGVNHVISLQPFGCIANHIVGKGVEKN